MGRKTVEIREKLTACPRTISRVLSSTLQSFLRVKDCVRRQEASHQFSLSLSSSTPLAPISRLSHATQASIRRTQHRSTEETPADEGPAEYPG